MNVRNSNKAIIIRDGKLLTIKKTDSGNTYYTLPGGGQDHGKTIHESLIRECIEETGVTVSVGELIYVRDYIGKNHTFSHVDSDCHQVEQIFLCEVINDENIGKGTLTDNGQVGVEWLEVYKLNEYDLYPAVMRTLIPGIGKVKQSIYLGDVD